MSYHPDIEETPFTDIPVGVDLCLCDEKTQDDFVEWLINSFETGDCSNNPAVSFSCWAENVCQDFIHLKVVIEFVEGHHRFSTFLPAMHFRACLDSFKYDVRPYVFVDSEWYASIRTKEFACFGLFDTIGVKKAIQSCQLSAEKLQHLEGKVQAVSEKYLDVLFVGFADSILLKQQWSFNNYDSSYRPDRLLEVYKELRSVYLEVLELDSYIVLSQGDVYWENWTRDSLNLRINQ